MHGDASMSLKTVMYYKTRQFYLNQSLLNVLREDTNSWNTFNTEQGKHAKSSSRKDLIESE